MASSEFHYDTICAKYGDGIPCPDDFSFPKTVVDKWAQVQPDQLALHWVAHDFSHERKYSYADLSDLSNRAAQVFRDAGLEKGDRVLVQLPRVSGFWFAVLGLMRLGCVPVPGTSLLVAKDLEFRARTASARAFIGDAESCGRFGEVASSVGVSRVFQIRTAGDGGVPSGRVDFDKAVEAVPRGTKCEAEQHSKTDLAIVFFTSGTTGAPKMVLLESEYLLGHTISGLWYRLKPGKLFLCMADLGACLSSFLSLSLLSVAVPAYQKLELRL